MTQASAPQIPVTLPNPIVIGIDWADKTHAVCLIDPPHPKRHVVQLPQHSEEIAAWAAGLKQKYPDRNLHVVLEQSKGALIHSLLATGFFTIFPINPLQLASYRKSQYPTGAKSDPGDAELLAQFLLHYPNLVRPYRPDSEQTRQLANLTEFRRKFVEERKRVTLQLTSTLKTYFPWIVETFSDKLNDPLVTKLLQRWPTLDTLQQAKPDHVALFLKEHGLRQKEKREQIVKSVRSAAPLTGDQAILGPYSIYSQGLARQLEELVKSIADFDNQIQKIVQVHEDTDLFRPIPGAGAALVPRLIVAFGSDRDRYQSAEEIQQYSGIAPVTQQSGKMRHVTRRRACPKFLHQTFHEFADHSRRWSRWAKAWYEHKKASGLKHNAAVRALAFKWIRVLFRIWKDRQPYSEERYIQALIKTNSPIANSLKNS